MDIWLAKVGFDNAKLSMVIDLMFVWNFASFVKVLLK